MDIWSIIPFVIITLSYYWWKKTKEKIYFQFFCLFLVSIVIDCCWFMAKGFITSIDQLIAINNFHFFLSSIIVILAVWLYAKDIIITNRDAKRVWREFIAKAKGDGIKKIIIGAIIENNGKFLFLEQAIGDRSRIVLPGALQEIDKDLENINILKTLKIIIKEETSLLPVKIITPVRTYESVPDLEGNRIAHLYYLVEVGPEKIKLNHNYYNDYYFITPGDEQYSKLNISDVLKNAIEDAQRYLAEQRKKNF